MSYIVFAAALLCLAAGALIWRSVERSDSRLPFLRPLGVFLVIFALMLWWPGMSLDGLVESSLRGVYGVLVLLALFFLSVALSGYFNWHRGSWAGLGVILLASVIWWTGGLIWLTAVVWPATAVLAGICLLIASRRELDTRRQAMWQKSLGAASMAAWTDPWSLGGWSFLKSGPLWSADFQIIVLLLGGIAWFAGSWAVFQDASGPVSATWRSVDGARQKASLIVFFLVLGLGWPVVEWSVDSHDQTMRASLRQKAQIMERVLHRYGQPDLRGVASEVKQAEYLRLKELLRDLSISGEFRFVYLLMVKEDSIIFLADSEPSGSPAESAIGDVWENVPPEVAQEVIVVRWLRSPQTVGPYYDEWGAWVTALLPVEGWELNGFPVILGIDRPAEDWYLTLSGQRYLVQGAVLLLCALALVSFFLLRAGVSSREKLVTSERRLRNSLEAAEMALWDYNPQTCEIRMEAAWWRKHGQLDFEEVMPVERWLRRMESADAESLMLKLDSLARCEANDLEEEVRMLGDEGRRRRILVRGRRIEASMVTHGFLINGVVRDITRRYEDRDALRLRSAALNAAASAVVITDAQGVIEWVNPAFCEATGYSFSEAIGQNPRVLKSGAHPAEYYRKMWETLQAGETWQGEIINRRKNGELYSEEAIITPVPDDSGKVSHFIAIKQDISKRKEMELAVTRQRAYLQQINDTLLLLGDDFQENARALTTLTQASFGAANVCYLREDVEQGGVSKNDCPQLSLEHQAILWQALADRDSCIVVRIDESVEGLEAVRDAVIASGHATLIGQPVMVGRRKVGLIALFFTDATDPNDELRGALALIAQALAREELLENGRLRLNALAGDEAAARSRLSTLLENLADAVLLEDPDRRVVFVNPAMEEIFGVSRDDLVGLDGPRVAEKLSGLWEDAEDFKAAFWEMRETGDTVRLDALSTCDGRYLSGSFSPVSSGQNFFGYLWHFQDITSQHNNRLLLGAVAELAAYVLGQPLETPEHWHKAAEILGSRLGLDGLQVFAFTPETERDPSAFSPVPVTSWQQPRAQWQGKDAEGSMAALSLFFTHWADVLRRDGTVFGRSDEFSEENRRILDYACVKSLAVVPLQVAGELWGALAFEDYRRGRVWEEQEIDLLRSAAGLISARLEIQRSVRDLVAAKEVADDASRAKSTFLATMSHEIRTPLNAVIGMSSLLAQTSLSEEQLGFARIIVSSGETLLELINDILDYSKIEAGKVDLEVMDFDAAETATEVRQLFKSPAKTKGISLECRVADGVPKLVRGDRTRFKQILINLLSNAIKFTGEGSVRVLLRIADQEKATRSLSVVVADTGIGMSGTALAKLFQPFEQADSTVTRKYGGTGLGLAICRRLVELMGGTIEARSHEGKGSEFEFLLPLVAVDTPLETWVETPEVHRVFDPHVEVAVAAVDKGTDSAPDETNLRILVAEDNMVNQKVLLALLKPLGQTADVVDNGKQAVEAVGKKDYDIVLLDVQMPVMDGLEAARRIRQHINQAGYGPYLVALTANAAKEDEEECLAAGMDAYFSKPVKLDVLRGLLSERQTCLNNKN